MVGTHFGTRLVTLLARSVQLAGGIPIENLAKDTLKRLVEIKQDDVTDKRVGGKIGRLRAEIGRVDSQIIQDLAERMRWVAEIGKLKQQHSIPVLQINQWENILEDHMAKAEQLGRDAEFVKAVFALIHAQAVNRQL